MKCIAGGIWSRELIILGNSRFKIELVWSNIGPNLGREINASSIQNIETHYGLDGGKRMVTEGTLHQH